MTNWIKSAFDFVSKKCDTFFAFAKILYNRLKTHSPYECLSCGNGLYRFKGNNPNGHGVYGQIWICDHCGAEAPADWKIKKGK